MWVAVNNPIGELMDRAHEKLATVRLAVYYQVSAATGKRARAIISVRLQILSRQSVIPSTGESRANQDD